MVDDVEVEFPMCDNTKCKFLKKEECSIAYFNDRMFNENCPYVNGKWPVGGWK